MSKHNLTWVESIKGVYTLSDRASNSCILGVVYSPEFSESKVFIARIYEPGNFYNKLTNIQVELHDLETAKTWVEQNWVQYRLRSVGIVSPESYNPRPVMEILLDDKVMVAHIYTYVYEGDTTWFQIHYFQSTGVYIDAIALCDFDTLLAKVATHLLTLLKSGCEDF